MKCQQPVQVNKNLLPKDLDALRHCFPKDEPRTTSVRSPWDADPVSDLLNWNVYWLRSANRQFEQASEVILRYTKLWDPLLWLCLTLSNVMSTQSYCFSHVAWLISAAAMGKWDVGSGKWLFLDHSVLGIQQVLVVCHSLCTTRQESTTLLGSGKVPRSNRQIQEGQWECTSDNSYLLSLVKLASSS